MLTFAQNLKKKLKRNMFMYRYTMQFLHKIRRKHLPFVVDELAYGRWQRIIPKPPILSAPVTYQPMLHSTCTMYVSDTIEESYKNATLGHVDKAEKWSNLEGSGSRFDSWKLILV